MKKFLHVGCGRCQKAQTTVEFNTNHWQEVRFDIDPALKPDIVGTMTDMSMIADNEYYALYSSHNIEHVYTHEIPKVIAEFSRVVKPEGFVIIRCPDLQQIGQALSEDRVLDVLYTSPSGPITALDLLYGHLGSVAAGYNYMAHKSGLTKSILSQVLIENGFKDSIVIQEKGNYQLTALATNSFMGKPLLTKLAEKHFPGLINSGRR